MSNMSYCKYHNTLMDLQDCYDSMDNEEEQLSPDEEKAKRELIELCTQIHNMYGPD